MMPWPAETLLQGRYRIVRELQQREATITYQALDLERQEPVILKCLNLGQLHDWQSYELFERELHVLAGLDHPRIPALRDHFELDQPGETGQSGQQNQRFAVLVLQLIAGQTLRERLQAGWRLNQDTARELAIQALEILIYLQSRQPPLIHRDIKPDNLLLDAENRLYLLDFGAARSYHHNPTHTAVGTFGYMAPEQALGQPPQPASDLYALGMTLVELLTRQSPQSLPRRDLHLDLQGLLNVSPAFQHWLEQMLEPDAKQRLFNAQQALNRLESGQEPDSDRPLPGTRLSIRHTNQQLLIQIHPAPLRSLLQGPILKRLLLSLGFALGLVIFAWLCLFSLMVWVNEVQKLTGLSDYAQTAGWAHQLGQAFALLSRLFIVWWVLRQTEAPLRLQTLRLQGGQLSYEVAGCLSRRSRLFDLANITSLGVTASGMMIETRPKRFLPVQAPLQAWLRSYGVPAPLSGPEQLLLQSELKRYLRLTLSEDQARTLLDNSF